ncbi:biotin--[acetyl-CoA-carboxylase] ligase [Cellulomonas sp. URHB0016]
MPSDDARAPFDPDELGRLLLAPAGPLARVEVVEHTASTNTDVVAALRADPEAWPDRGLLVAHHQTGGRGRAGRTWETPAGTAVTCSFVVRPQAPADRWGWLPLLAGLAAVTAVRATTGVPALLKWPNDVLVPADTVVEGWGAYRKVGGILTEVVPASPGHDPAVVIGIGLNVSQSAGELPVESASSLALAGARHVDRLGLVVALVTALDAVVSRWGAVRGDARASGLADEVAAVCGTIDSRVRVEEPGGGFTTGVVRALDDDGALVVVDDEGGTHHVLAGDVRHVRDAG